MRHFLLRLGATGFGLGMAPVAPGTFGTLGAIPLYYLLSSANVYTYMGVTFIAIIGSVFICEFAEPLFGKHDSKHIVIDEIVGFLVAMTWVPLHWKTLIAGFILFRFFDAVKPWPISVLDRKIKGGLGVVCDDVAAGLVTNIILQGVLMYTTWFGFQI